MVFSNDFLIRFMDAGNSEVKRVCDLVNELQRWQKMKCCPRLPEPQDLVNELTRDGARGRISNNKNTYTSVAIDKRKITGSSGASYLVGYMIYSFSFSIIDGMKIWINSFYIEEAYRAQGLGKMFMEFLKIHASTMGIKTVDVPVMNDNEFGLKFYSRYNSRLVNEEFQIMAMPIEDESGSLEHTHD